MIDKSKTLTEKPKFVPSAYMVVWIDVAVQNLLESPSEIEAACKEANSPVSRQAYYEWLKKPGFIDWYNEEWNKRLKIHAPRLDVIGIKNAKRDFKYWESMQKRVGNIKEEQKGIYIQQNFTEHAKNELKEFE